MSCRDADQGDYVLEAGALMYADQGEDADQLGTFPSRIHHADSVCIGDRQFSVHRKILKRL